MKKWFSVEKQFSFEQMARAFSYDAETGEIKWKVSRRGGNAWPGMPAGHLNRAGYRMISFSQARLMAHRLAWLLHHGEWPEMSIDHKNLNKDDNRIENLRVATLVQNQANRGVHRNNKCGFKNVCFRRQMKKKWEARIVENGKQRVLGYFDTPEEAHAAYAAAAERLHGEFARAA